MKQLPLEAFTEYRFLSGINASPCGEWTTYHIHTSDMDANHYQSNLWCVPTAGGDAIQLTQSGKAAQHLWLNDSQQILYPSLKNEKHQKMVDNNEPLTVYYSIALKPGESSEYMQLPLTVTGIQAIDENLFLVTGPSSETLEAYRALPESARQEFLKNQKEELDYEVIDEIPFWTNGGTFLRGSRNRLYLFERTTQTLKPLTDSKLSVSSFKWSAEHRQIVVVAKSYQDRMPLESDIYLIDLDLQNTVKLTDSTHSIAFAEYWTKDQLIILASDKQQYGMNQNPTFFTMNITPESLPKADFKPVLMPIAPQYKDSTGNTVGSDCRYGQRRTLKVHQERLFFLTTVGGNAYLNVLNSAGDINILHKMEGTVEDFDLIDNRLIMSAMRANNLAEIFTASLVTQPPVLHLQSDGLQSETDYDLFQLTSHNSWLLSTYSFSAPIPHKVTISCDLEIEGWVLKPTDFDNNKTYPAILNIHGGPKTAYGSILYHEMQVWANRGYFVFFCNPRGSDGRGNAFADIRGRYGTIDYQDLMSFTDSVTDHFSEIDQEQLFVTGGSYGGFMTNWIVGHTNRFRAAASQRSISNWTTEFGVTDIGYYFVPDQIAADPWSDYEKLWEASPLKYANQVTTPTLFIHSDQDYRCWIPEALQMYTALKYHGVETRLCWFKGENHELSRSGKPKHRIRRLLEITEWFDQHQSK